MSQGLVGDMRCCCCWLLLAADRWLLAAGPGSHQRSPARGSGSRRRRRLAARAVRLAGRGRVRGRCAACLPAAGRPLTRRWAPPINPPGVVGAECRLLVGSAAAQPLLPLLHAPRPGAPGARTWAAGAGAAAGRGPGRHAAHDADAPLPPHLLPSPPPTPAPLPPCPGRRAACPDLLPSGCSAHSSPLEVHTYSGLLTSDMVGASRVAHLSLHPELCILSASSQTRTYSRHRQIPRGCSRPAPSPAQR
jgi:hypothetical protein